MTETTAAAATPQTFARGKRGNFDNRLDEVLRVAARLFSLKGFKQATLEDVAAVLNVTRPALYHYARSKDELVAKCLELATAVIDTAIEDARRQKTGRAQVEVFFRRYAEIICDDFGRCFVLVNRREYGPELQEAGRTYERKIDRAARAMISAGVADGSLRTVDPADVARALFGAFNGIPVWYKAGGGRTPAQIADNFLSLFLSGVAP